MLPRVISGLTAWRPRPLPATFADQEDDEDDEENQKDDGEENAGYDPDLLGQRVVDRRQHDLVNADEEPHAALVQDILPVDVELSGDTGDDGVVVAKVGAVLDSVVDVGGVVVPHCHDFRLGREVDVGLGRVGPAQLWSRKSSSCSATDLKNRNNNDNDYVTMSSFRTIKIPLEFNKIEKYNLT